MPYAGVDVSALCGALAFALSPKWPGAGTHTAECNRARDAQLDFRACAGTAPHVQFPADVLSALAHPGDAVVARAPSLLHDGRIDALAVIADADFQAVPIQDL